MRQLRARFPALRTTTVARDEDTDTVAGDRVLFRLVFRGQNKEHRDSENRLLVVPRAARTGVSPTWVQDIPDSSWVLRWDYATTFLASAETLGIATPPSTDRFQKQIRAYRAAIAEYCRTLEGVETGAGRGEPERLLAVLDYVAADPIGTLRQHPCILWNWGTEAPPLRALLRDLKRFHNPALIPYGRRTLVNDYLAYSVWRNSSAVVATGMLEHYGLPTNALDVTLDPNIALWFALHHPSDLGRATTYTHWPRTGYVYAFWVPVRRLWPGYSVRRHRWERSRGGELARVQQPLELALLVDLEPGMTFGQRDMNVRATRQRAAMLTGRVVNPEWPAHAYSRYLVASLAVSPDLAVPPDPTIADKWSVEHLFPSPTQDRLLASLIAAGVEGVRQYE